MAEAIRLHVEAGLDAGTEITATPAQAHRLGTVMRRGPGDAVRLFNGRDGEWDGHIAALGRGRAVLVAERLRRSQAPEPGPTLVFALLKRDATDLIVEKATELGAACLRPVVTARTVAHRVALDRLAAIAAEAAEQCERLTVPVVEAPRSLADVIAAWRQERSLAAAIERLDAPGILAYAGLTAEAGLLVGPEGGFTPAELDLLRSRPFVVAVSLGPRVLRAETAVIVGLALLQARSLSIATPTPTG
jgi:16S rRNA (uracil1498-N3)-methyltransferase